MNNHILFAFRNMSFRVMFIFQAKPFFCPHIRYLYQGNFFVKILWWTGFRVTSKRVCFPQKMLDGKHRRDYYGNSVCPCSLVVRSKADLCHMTPVRDVSCKALSYMFISKLKFMFMCYPGTRRPRFHGMHCISYFQVQYFFSAWIFVVSLITYIYILFFFFFFDSLQLQIFLVQDHLKVEIRCSGLY